METKKFIIKIDPSSLIPKNALKKYYLITVGMIGIMILGIVGIWRYLPMSVPLFFTAPWGEARLAPKIFLFLIPLMGLVVVMVNLILAKIAKDVSSILTQILIIGAMVTEIMLTIALAGIVQSVI